MAELLQALYGTIQLHYKVTKHQATHTGGFLFIHTFSTTRLYTTHSIFGIIKVLQITNAKPWKMKKQ